MAKTIVVSVVADAPDPDPEPIQGQSNAVRKVIWQIEKPIPGDETSIIKRMFLIDGAVQVYAVPNIGTGFYDHQQALRFTIMPQCVRAVMELVPFHNLQEMIKESEAISEGIEEEEDDDDYEDEEETPQISQVPQMTQAPQIPPQQQPEGMPPIPNMPLPSSMPNT
jgi:hypothetical protein